MKRALLALGFCLSLGFAFAQDINIRIVQTNYSAIDPDGAGDATGTVTIEFQLQTTTGTVEADAMGLSFVFQSSQLMPTPTNTTTFQGPVAAAGGWIQNADNRAGAVVAVSYGTRNFDRRMLIAMHNNGTQPTASITTAWTPVAQVTYWTRGVTNPQGGYATPEPASIVAQNEVSADGGLSTYPYLSPDLNSPIPLGSGGIFPVLYTHYNVDCNDKGARISWSTSSESNSSHFEIEKSLNGQSWKKIGVVAAAGTSTSNKNYEWVDLDGGQAYYRLQQVDKNGVSKQTNVLRATCEGRDFSVVLYPNPVKDKLNVVIKSTINVKTELQVFDMQGRIVKRMPVTVNGGNNNFTIGVDNLPGGEYILRSSDPAIQVNKKFVIAR